MLELREVYKSYQGQALLRGISFRVGPGETVCLLGPSGSGKSTLLNLIAGLEEAERGRICWAGQDLAGVPAHRRGFGLVFQDYALFPHLDVFENVTYGLRTAGLPRPDINLRVAAALEKVKMTAFQQRRVTDLSGGEQQRVALARAIAPQPRLLMFDETLGALDRSLREGLLEELRLLLHQTRIPAIYVTHDQEEAFAIADRVCLLHEGRIVREGSPAQVWEDPGSVWAARFLGAGNVLEGEVFRQNGKIRLRGSFGDLPLSCPHGHADGQPVAVLLRPAGLPVNEPGADTIRGRVSDSIFQRNGFKVTLENGLYFFLPAPARIGEKLTLKIEAHNLLCLGEPD
jgi:spermidine/putrescine transport system ATP-binding protein